MSAEPALIVTDAPAPEVPPPATLLLVDDEPGVLSALRRVATIESIGSSTRIEGSKLTDREVEVLDRGAGVACLPLGHDGLGQRTRHGAGAQGAGIDVKQFHDLLLCCGKPVAPWEWRRSR